MVDQKGEVQAITFQLGKEMYGIDVHQIKEIIKVKEYVKVPNAPDYIEGVINLRGQITPIVDLRKIFGMDHKEFDDNSRIIMVEFESDVVGLIVDCVVGVVTVPIEEIVKSPSIAMSANNSFISGIIRSEDNLTILIDVVRLLSERCQVKAEEGIKATRSSLYSEIATVKENLG
ncbi:MAG: chemotaxis protein CheW [Candidatus Methanosuratincola sp.]|uniref:Chemotaxis protein CheW n=2 Tax=Candidatus Methanosuratincola (ex Vanwonterghem et al. 2016) TaxID=1915412 RepID=A0A7J3V0F9_9CREN|nr:chemotaxis protein CheW [Candidatus Methanosuratincola sp.]RWX73305.1 MAG: Positive regulator of CheA protein activity (CheW) [Candidatus Methanosuratincola subterraneus]